MQYHQYIVFHRLYILYMWIFLNCFVDCSHITVYARVCLLCSNVVNPCRIQYSYNKNVYFIYTVYLNYCFSLQWLIKKPDTNILVFMPCASQRAVLWVVRSSLARSLDLTRCVVSLLQLVHSTVVDTAIVFPHRLGSPYKRALRNLMADYLKRIIQDNGEALHPHAHFGCLATFTGLPVMDH